MPKVRVKIITLGRLPPHVDLEKINSWRSQVFEIAGPVENQDIRRNSDGMGWEFSDALLSDEISVDPTVGFVFVLTSIPLEMNWYSRRIGRNRVVLTFHEVKDFLRQENIPLENLVLRVLYAYTLVFLRSGNKIPDYVDAQSYAHDETRGCLYDMNGVKSDIVESCVAPVICGECQEKMRVQRVSNNTILAAQNELKKIRKDAYFRAADFVRRSPLSALAISSIFALLIGTAGSIFASYIYEVISK
jgi:hypothetical protein